MLVLSARTRCSALALLTAAGGLLIAAPSVRAEERNVTVIAVMATDRNKHVDPRVQGIAEEVQKLEPGLTGFRVARTTSKAVTFGKRDTFPLVDNEVLGVLLQQAEGKDGQDRARLTVKAPLAGDITYSCCSGKFFPILTRYLTKDNERLIVAIMVKPAKK
jgi:hypothetical protein